MLELQCDICKRTLHEPGALIFSPPTPNAWIVEKYHVCTDCWPKVLTMLNKQIPADQIRSTEP
jgi:hypothetical protein